MTYLIYTSFSEDSFLDNAILPGCYSEPPLIHGKQLVLEIIEVNILCISIVNQVFLFSFSNNTKIRANCQYLPGLEN